MLDVNFEKNCEPKIELALEYGKSIYSIPVL